MPSEKIRIDQVLLQSGVRLSKEYLENTYGVQVEDAPADTQKKRAAKAQNRRVSDELLALYAPVAYALRDEMPSFAVPVEAWLRKIFAGKQKAVDGKSAHAVMDYLARAVDKGYGKTIVSLPFGEQAHTLLAELQYNAGTFAALKNHAQMQRPRTQQLKDERGRLREFPSVQGRWHWPSTSSTTSSGSGRNIMQPWELPEPPRSGSSTAKPKNATKTSNMWPSKTNARGKAHRVWDGIVLPIGHKFWEVHYPPNGWNCRCHAVSTDETANRKAPKTEQRPAPSVRHQLREAGEGIWGQASTLQGGWRGSGGRQGSTHRLPAKGGACMGTETPRGTALQKEGSGGAIYRGGRGEGTAAGAQREVFSTARAEGHQEATQGRRRGMEGTLRRERDGGTTKWT